MALETTDNRKEYAGNGVTTGFSFPYYFLANADLIVYLKNNTTGVAVLQVLTTNYTLTGAGVEAGGTVTMLVAPPSGYTLIIYRDPSITQGTDFRENDSFPAEQAEQALDRSAMISQRLAERVSRKLGFADDAVIGSFDLSIPEDLADVASAGKVFIVNAAGDGFDVGPTADAIEDANADAIAAAASAAAALASQTAAASSASAAATSASAASTSASAAATSASGASTSASAAAASATTASTQATNAAASATTASTQATNAAASATTASTQASNASTSATNAAASATAASGSATAASGSAAAAALSAASTTGVSNYASDAAFVAANGAAQTGDFYYNTATNRLRYYNGSAWGDVGTGSGGGINYAGNPDAETDASLWTVAKNSVAAATPDSGFSTVSTNITFARNTSSPLRGNGDFLFTKGAANRQGEMVYTPLTIAAADAARLMDVTFTYKVASGTYADGDIRVYLWDVTNSVLIEPTSRDLKNAVGATPYRATFQTPSNSTSLRLLLFVSSTSASAYTVQFDDFVVTPQKSINGAFESDWLSYTPTFTGFGTVSGIEFQYMRSGPDILVRGKVVAGTSTATEARVSLPTGLVSASTTAIPSIQMTGAYVNGAVSTNNHGGPVMIEPATAYMTFGDSRYAGSGSVNPISKATGDNVVTSAGTWSMFARFPIAGWGSNVTYASEAGDGRVIAMRATGAPPTGTLNGSDNTVIFGTVDKDTHSAYNAATGVYTVPVSGLYHVDAMLTYSYASITAGQQCRAKIAINGTAKTFCSVQAGASTVTSISPVTSGIFDCVAGDTITILSSSAATTPAFSSTAYASLFCVNRISGPAAIAAAESVSVRATNTSAQAITNSSTAVLTGWTKTYDSHNAFVAATGVFTVPVAGKYRITAKTISASTAWTVGTNKNAALAVSGTKSIILNECIIWASITTYQPIHGSTTENFAAGDTISVSLINGLGSTYTLLNDATENWITIERVGN